MSGFRPFFVAILSICVGVVSASADPKPVELPPVTHENAQLVIFGDDGSRQVYTPEQLEAFPTYQIETTTPWRDEPAIFSGILLADLLEFHGLMSGKPLRVIAENEFSTIFESSVLKAAPILVATRVNGAPHSRRARGPIQLIVEDSVYHSDARLTESHLVWMASRIELAR